MTKICTFTIYMSYIYNYMMGTILPTGAKSTKITKKQVYEMSGHEI